eukprot:gene738-802_t
MSKFGRRTRSPPAGFEYIEPTLTALENELRERVNEPHEGLRKNESQWPIHQINWQKSRYVYDMYYTFKRISKEVYDYCVNNKIVDSALIAKWKKPGYERLCSTYVINPKNYKFGTVSICRVPKQSLAPGAEIEDPTTGCRGCASGSSHNIFGNKYGQYLAAIQVAREEKMARKAALLEKLRRESEDVEDEEEEEEEEERDDEENEKEDSPNQPKGLSGKGAVQHGEEDGQGGAQEDESNIWVSAAQAENVELTSDMIGQLAPEARLEGVKAASKAGLAKADHACEPGPPEKRSRRN